MLSLDLLKIRPWVTEPSPWVRENIGVGGVCEPCALLATSRGKLILPKFAHEGVTVAIVDAYGSESYGIAIVYGREPGGKGATPAPGRASVVCVYDKRTKKAELSGIIETNFSR